jgi:hypothetical protein
VQVYDPLGAPWLSTLAAAVPIVTLLVTLGLLEWRAHRAAAAGLVAALLARRVALAAFAAGFFALGFAGLLVVYWIATLPLGDHLFNTSNRTVDSLVFAAVSLVPVLVGRIER